MAKRRIKVLMVGPVKGGKTLIATHLSDTTENLTQQEYRPTQGVRILEFEGFELSVDDVRVEPDVELWDCSGDRRFEQCWPALRRFADALIMVCDPTETRGEDLTLWHNEFVQKIGLRPEQVMVLLNHSDTNDSAIADFRLPGDMLGVRCVPADVAKEGDQLKQEFTKFLNAVSKELENRG